MIGDFSKAAVERAVLAATLQHSLTLYPIAVGVVGMVAVVLLVPSFGWLLVAIAAVTLGVSSWIVNFCFRSEVYADRYIQSLHDALARQRQARLESLQGALEACQTVPGAESLAAAGRDAVCPHSREIRQPDGHARPEAQSPRVDVPPVLRLG